LLFDRIEANIKFGAKSLLPTAAAVSGGVKMHQKRRDKNA
jgi:hypothetical protein